MEHVNKKFPFVLLFAENFLLSLLLVSANSPPKLHAPTRRECSVTFAAALNLIHRQILLHRESSGSNNSKRK